MKLTNGKPTISPKPRNQSQSSDLQPNLSRKSPRRKTIFSGAGDRLRKAGKQSRPETPLLKWKVEDECPDAAGGGEAVPENGRRRKDVSARKLGAVLWRMQSAGGSSGMRSSRAGFGFKPNVGHAGMQFLCHQSGKTHTIEAKDILQSAKSIHGTKNSKLEPSPQFSSSMMEGATKWDPINSRLLDELHHTYGQMKHIDQQVSAVPMVSVLEGELEQSHTRIQELEIERHSSKKKLEHFLRKVSEEKAAWKSREHEKIRAFIVDVKADLKREKKNRQRLEILNDKLVNELADTKMKTKCYMHDYEKERKTRELIEEVCDELAKEVGEDKAEVDALKRESMKFRNEVEEERKMLQMAEVWREERVQMKLVDAKLALEEKYSQMNKLVAQLETFLRGRGPELDVKEVKEAESLLRAADSINIQEFKDFKYEPSNPDDIFSVFEDVNFGELNDRDIEPCVGHSPVSHASEFHAASPEVNVIKKGSIQRHSSAFSDQNGEIEDDESGWETVSHLEDQDSSYSPEGSAMSVNKNRQDSTVSAGGTDYEDKGGQETPLTDISEVCSVPSRQLTKPSIARLWRSCSNNGDNYKIISVEGGRISNGRMSNASIVSLDRGSYKGGFSPLDMMGQCSSPESGYPNVARGRKGCIEWPRGMQKNSLKAKLLEARLESQKIQLRQVLNQKFQ